MRMAVVLAFALSVFSGITTNGTFAGEWDTLLSSTNGPSDGCRSARFTCVLNGEAVRDNETGLVWQRDADQTPRTWRESVRACWQIPTGGRFGWHLPTIEELSSIIDLASPTPPKLPPGHPFIDVFSAVHWSSTPDPRTEVADAWHIDLETGDVQSTENTGAHFAWCVRSSNTVIVPPAVQP